MVSKNNVGRSPSAESTQSTSSSTRAPYSSSPPSSGKKVLARMGVDDDNNNNGNRNNAATATKRGGAIVLQCSFQDFVPSPKPSGKGKASAMASGIATKDRPCVCPPSPSKLRRKLAIAEQHDQQHDDDVSISEVPPLRAPIGGGAGELDGSGAGRWSTAGSSCHSGRSSSDGRYASMPSLADFSCRSDMMHSSFASGRSDFSDDEEEDDEAVASHDNDGTSVVVFHAPTAKTKGMVSLQQQEGNRRGLVSALRTAESVLYAEEGQEVHWSRARLPAQLSPAKQQQDRPPQRAARRRLQQQPKAKPKGAPPRTPAEVRGAAMPSRIPVL